MMSRKKYFVLSDCPIINTLCFETGSGANVTYEYDNEIYKVV